MRHETNAQALEAGSANEAASPIAAKCPIPWWKRLTLLTFMFFLIKGLAWLVVPAVLIWWRSIAGE
jgi:hypothetical protein